jgi:hypothetical protein
MCKRQIDRRTTPPAPSNDNNPKPAERLMNRRRPGLRSGILSIVLERTERVKLDFLANGVLQIQGPRSYAPSSDDGRKIVR